MGEGRSATKHEGNPFLDSTAVPSVREMTTDAMMFASVTVLFDCSRAATATGPAGPLHISATPEICTVYFKPLTPNTHTLTTMRLSMVVL